MIRFMSDSHDTAFYNIAHSDIIELFTDSQGNTVENSFSEKINSINKRR